MSPRPEANEAEPRLRVVMATARFPPFSGGVELHTDQVTRRLAAGGVAVTMLTTDVTGSLPAYEARDGVEVRRFRAWPRNRDYYFAPGLYSALVRGNWDVLHVQSFQTLVAPIAMLAAIRRGLPYVVTFHEGGHSSRIRRSIAPRQLKLLGPLLRRAAALVALTEDEIDVYAELLRVPRSRFALIPNGSDLPSTAAVAATVRNKDLIASLGRLERYKGHHRVLAALPHLIEQRPGLHLRILGGGPYGESLRALAKRLGVADRVDFREIPIQERERMAIELAEVELVISLSEFEAQGIAILEALAMGCRAVVADVPGLTLVAQRGLARAIPLTSSSEDVATAIIEELERPGADTPKLPTWDGCSRALLELYTAVLASRSAP
jgi:glycosyltransferase involved in cell wall biosynthesis